MKTIQNKVKKRLVIKNLIKITTILLMVINLTSCNDDEDCNYTAHNDCASLGLNIGDVCDSNGDGELDGIVNDSCECIDNTFPYSCTEGMEVAFLIDYTGSMGGAIDGVKTNVSAIVGSINSLSLSNYKLALSLFDEVEKATNPSYFSQTDYTSLPINQKMVVNTGVLTDQYLTVMEKFISNNNASFSTQLTKLNNTMSLGYGVGTPEPGDLLLNEILDPNIFAGTWSSLNITKVVIIITDAPAGGDDDTANSTDDAYLQNLATIANAAGIQCILVSSQAISNYEELIDNNNGGLKLMNADFNNIATDIINLLEELCDNNVG